MNPFGSLHRAGVPLAFGTDAPVTPIAGWAMVQAAVQHWRSEERLSPAERVRRGHRGGHRAGRSTTPAGSRSAGGPTWRSGTSAAQTSLGAGLPGLAAGEPLPECAATVAGGRIVYTSDLGWIG